MVAVFLGFQIGNSFFASQVETEEEMEIYEAVPDAEEIDEEQIDEEVTDEEIVTPDEDSDISAETVLDDEPVEQDQPEDTDIAEGDSNYYIQVGAFGSEENANNLRDDLNNRGYQTRVEGTEPYRVQVAGGNTRDNAEEIATELQGLGFETLIISQ